MNTPHDSANFRILVVDDNPAIHDDFRKILCPAQSRGGAALDSIIEDLFDAAPQKKHDRRFEVDSAFQGQEALDKVRQAEEDSRPYSLAFMDVRMPPGWDGIETIQHIWKAYPHIQVVVCTAYSDYSWDQILENLGDTDSLVILRKPFDNVEVLQLAHALTKKWMVTRQVNARVADLDRCVRERTRELLDANQQLQGEIQRRSQVEAALRESEARFRQAFETVAVPLTISSLETGQYLDVNQSFLELCGFTKPEILGKSPAELDLIPDPGRLALLIQGPRENKKVRSAELLVRAKAGRLRQTLLSLEILKLENQPCLLAAFQDVTEQRRLESRLRQSQKLEAVGQLAAGVAHDFNNLLTVIYGYSSLQLAKASLDADVARAFDQVKAASERAAALTRQLLAFSRKQMVQPKPIDLGAAIFRMRHMLGLALGSNVKFECHLEEALPIVNADESSLVQVFMNLAANAREAMPNGGTFSLSAGVSNITPAQAAAHHDVRTGAFVVFTVKDTGCGMDEQMLSRIFEPFFTTKPIGRGAGLGLSTVYGILRQHEGWIEVDSRVGSGTTFRLFLPAANAPADQNATSAHPAPGQPLKSAPSDIGSPETAPHALIFVVEDEPDVRDFMAMILANEGYRILQASSGADALLKWKTITEDVHLLLTDMVMPGGVSGMALADYLIRRKPGLRVVYSSGYSPDGIANGYTLEEGVNFIAKPFTPERLLGIVRSALSSPAPTATASEPAGAVQLVNRN